MAMPGLSDSKRRAMSMLMDRAPEAVLEAIETRFQTAGGGLAADVVSLARDQRMARSLLRQTFGNVVALAHPRADGVSAPRFPSSTPKALWRAVVDARPELAAEMETRLRIDPSVDLPVGLVDGACAIAATALRNSAPSDFGLPDQGAAMDLAGYLDIVPIARQANGSLNDWLGRLDGDQLTALRLTFKDADAVREDGGARLMELLMAGLPRAAEVLRLISALTDQASADFIDGTELASFPARLLDHAELLAESARFDPSRIDASEAQAGIARLTGISEILREFDLAFPGAAGGSWTRRLQILRRSLTDQLEANFRAIPAAAEKALPLGSTRIAGRMSRFVPDLSADPGAPAVARAKALVDLLCGTRSIAADLGCEGSRRAAAEAVAERADSYAEEALAMLHDHEPEDRERAIRLIEIAAEFLSLSRNFEAGSLVRRRVAVAIAADPQLGGAAA